MMRVSILIACKDFSQAMMNCQKFNFVTDSKIQYEIILCEGNDPSVQRNLLAESAKCEWLLFLDDDSLPEANLLTKYNEVIKLKGDANVIGGPSLLEQKKNTFNKISFYFFSSPLGIGPLRSRYNQIGKLRETDEKELILCNLLIKKDFFHQTKGFKKNLHPSEENDFLKSNKTEIKAYYSPEAIIRRPPRETLSEFLKQMYSYGKGRSKHLNFADSIFLIPAAFTLYILLTSFMFLKLALLIPLFIYCFLIFSSIIFHSKKVSLALLSVPFFFLGHFSYGGGVTIGLIKRMTGMANSKTQAIAELKVYKPLI